MKKMNLSALSNWQPRPPAAGLKQRIFAARPAAPEARSFWNLLVPAAACMMLSLAMLNSGSLRVTTNNGLVSSTILNNLRCSAYLPLTAQNVQNHMDGLSFEWTNRSLLRSPIGFTSSTN